MRRKNWIMVAALSMALAGMALAGERRISRNELPPKVAEAVSQLSKNATLRGLNEEREHGETFYEAELMVSGHSKDVLMDASGNAVEVEEQVSLQSLPAAVRQGLQQQANGAEIVKVESLSKRGKLVAYEAAVRKDGKGSEVQVGPNGKKLGRAQ